MAGVRSALYLLNNIPVKEARLLERWGGFGMREGC